MGLPDVFALHDGPVWVTDPFTPRTSIEFGLRQTSQGKSEDQMGRSDSGTAVNDGLLAAGEQGLQVRPDFSVRLETSVSL